MLGVFVDKGAAWNQIVICIGCIMEGNLYLYVDASNHKTLVTVMKFKAELLE
jgi:hypothetical protein